MSDRRLLNPIQDRGPLRVLFAITSMPVGGAETLLVNLVRRLDRDRFQPEICCLKEPGPLGLEIAEELPLHSGLLQSRFDLRVMTRLRELLRSRRIDAIVTVGAGDKMFWGRLAAWRERLPVILSAIHSTGWPDGIGLLNRCLTPITDGFIAVAERHGKFLVENQRFPERKVYVVPNGIDVQRFAPNLRARLRLRAELGIEESTPVCGIVAALRPEKNLDLFLQTAARTAERCDARFLVVGDGPERFRLQMLSSRLSLDKRVMFLGSRSDVPELLNAMDLFALTSDNEANPVSIIEAMATGLPVVSTNVGSVSESVQHGVTGFLTPVRDVSQTAGHWERLFRQANLRQEMGRNARRLVADRSSLERMVSGYEELIEQVYQGKAKFAFRTEREVDGARSRPTHSG